MDTPFRLPLYAAVASASSEAMQGSASHDDAPMQVGELAQRTGKTVRALHLYEEMGLLRPLARSKGGYRLYGSEAIVRIRFISKLQELGFSLTEVKATVLDFESASSAPDAMEKMRALYQEKLEAAREQIRKYAQLEKELEASLAYLDGCEVREPERVISECKRCEHHAPTATVPELVSGLRANPPTTASVGNASSLPSTNHSPSARVEREKTARPKIEEELR